MKKNLMTFVILIFILLPLSAQKKKDVLYLKNGSIINGKLMEITDNKYKIRTSDGSIFIYSSEEVEKFVNEVPSFEGRKKYGFGFGLEAGFLVGSQSSDFDAPFSFNILAGYTASTKNLISLGSGVEFIGKSYSPLFIEYRYSFQDRKTVPFLFVRGGKLFYVGKGDENVNGDSRYNPRDFKGGFSCTVGTGISWVKDNLETFISFAYRYAATSYVQMDYNNYDATYKNSYNRLEVKLGFRF